MPINKRNLLPIVIIIIAVLAVYWNSLYNGFVWDDTSFLVGNKVYMDFALRKIFFSLANGLEYLPLRDVSYAIDYALWGGKASGFHFTNLLLYVANLIVLYYVAIQITRHITSKEKREITATSLVALFATLFFAMHPIQAQAVNFITCRNVLLSGLFFFLSCSLYLKFISSETNRAQRWYYSGALLCFLCALLSKATTIVLPLVLLLFTAYDFKRNQPKKLLHLAPFFALSLGFYIIFKKIGLQTGVIVEQIQGVAGSSIMAKTAIALQIPFFYLKKLILPVGFSAEYDVVFATSLADPVVVASLVTIVMVFVAAIIVREKCPELLFGLFWTFLTLLPVLNFFATNPVVADRYAYLPSFGVFYLVSALLARLSNGWKRKWYFLCPVLLLFWWSAATFSRNSVWQSDKTLWEDTLKVSKNAKVYLLLAEAYMREENYDKAFALLAAATKLDPLNDYYDYHIGRLSLAKRDFTTAITALKKVVSLNGNFIDALFLLARAYEASGDNKQAIVYYNKTLESAEQDTHGYRDAARKALLKLTTSDAGQLDDLKKIVADNPRDVAARGNLALRLDALNLHEEALKNYREMERLGVDSWQLSYNIATVYKKMRNYRDAARYYERSLARNPANADALNNVGLVYREMKEYAKSITAFERALAVNGRFSYALFNLAATYLEMGDTDNALRHFRDTQEQFPELRDKVKPYLQQLESTRRFKLK